MLTDEELEQQVNEWNKQPVIYPKDTSILELFESWANKTPDAVAIFCGGRSYSYSEINTQANRVAHSLLQMGLKPEGRVLVGIERSSEFISAILGILKAGGVYVPIDPQQPRDRINAIIKDLNPFCLISHSTFSACFSECNHLCIDQLPRTSLNNPELSFSQDQLAYIIYTSGSTGRPKGVAIDYRSINDRVLWKNVAYPLCPHDVMLHTYSFIFDGSIINYFWPLSVGASLVIATNEEQIDSLALIHLIKQHSVTTMDLLPSLLQNLLEEENVADCSSLRIVFSGGEALLGSTIQSFYQKFPKIKLHNTYGPTEATVEASAWECRSDYIGSIAPIGKPIAGTHLFILDTNRNIVPIGVPGELHIGGIGLARGYFNDPSLTAEKFISDPLGTNPNERLYRTGDLCRYRADGNIEFLGRIDNQVKIRGYRIDLGEI
ncbi:MAG: amino acid adenylation domain-containing protein, partial [Verrucomicrobia bacterium]|nr:amino acid adenylation domain-containing protein [Verrucomicrobiota bacterium]